MTVALSQAVNPSIIESDLQKDRKNDLYVKTNVKKITNRKNETKKILVLIFVFCFGYRVLKWISVNVNKSHDRKGTSEKDFTVL